MSKTGLEVFDTTLQETNHWLRLMMAELDSNDRRRAFAALRAGLHALRDRIGAVNAVHLGAQLPMLLRGAYYEGWRLPGSTRERHAEDYLNHVDSHLPRNSTFDASEVALATFRVLAQCLDPGETRKLRRILPPEIGALWPAAPSPKSNVLAHSRDVTR
jgi:uncharacterized protein (DUF2267 family)